MSYLLHNVFKKTVLERPNNTAIKHESGQTISYDELNKLANQFSNCYLTLNLNKKYPYIGILSPVNINGIAAILGTLKIGFAYVPLDEQSPPERIEKIIISCQINVLIIDKRYYKKYCMLFNLPIIKKIIVLCDKELIEIKKYSDKEPPSITVLSDDLAYILHTSGSTGIPKGIMLTHRNARTFVDWMQKEFQLNEMDRVISRAPFKFDLSIFDIFNTFKTGAILICSDDDNKNHEKYVDLMIREGATFLYTTPSTFISLMNHGKLSEKSHQLKLRTIMYAGEPFHIPQLKKLKTILPNTKMANIYGPTETNIITYFWIDNLEGLEDIPLGKEVDDTEIFIVSEDGKHICDINEIGEIWCRGGTVAIGYHNKEDATSQCKVNSPFHSYPTTFWRTGDYGYRDEKGLLHYKGRKDHMIKIKGYRIELGEIESALSEINQLDEYAVVVKQDRLLCYYSSLSNLITEDQLEEHLKRKLPEYMLPKKYIQLPKLPKTTSEKIDRIFLTEQSI